MSQGPDPSSFCIDYEDDDSERPAGSGPVDLGRICRAMCRYTNP